MAAKPNKESVCTYARVRRFLLDRESVKPCVQAQAKTAMDEKGHITITSAEDDAMKPLQTDFTDVLDGNVSEKLFFSILFHVSPRNRQMSEQVQAAKRKQFLRMYFCRFSKAL